MSTQAHNNLMLQGGYNTTRRGEIPIKVITEIS